MRKICVLLSILLYCNYGICAEYHSNLMAEDMFVRKANSARAERHCLLGLFYEEHVMETAQKEEWRQIADYPGYYISNLGRVKSVRILKPSESREYLGLSLTKIDIPRCRKHFSIHRLVLISFKGLDPNRCEANHINGIKTDNRLENLEWVTRSENTKHSYAIGLQIVTAKSNEKRSKALRGEKSYRAKLTEKDIPIIRQLRNDGLTYKAISQRFNVSLSTIYHVISGRGWKSS